MNDSISMVLDIISWVLMGIGGLSVLIGGIGVTRMPDFYARLHAASLTDTMATLALFAGLMIQGGLTLATVKVFTIMLFLLLTGPTATYALANSALMVGMKPDAEALENDEDET